VLEQDSFDVNENACERICRINYAEVARDELDAAFFGTVGDVVCPCGLWRPQLQNLRQCGLMVQTPITPDRTPLSGIRGRSVAIENTMESMRACVTGEETVDYRWIDWHCDASRARNALQRYQAGYTVVPQDKRTITRAKQKPPSGPRTKVTPRPTTRIPKQAEPVSDAPVSAAAATAGADAEKDEPNLWQ
jgi:hypothetical protein